MTPEQDQPFIPPQQSLPEVTIIVVGLSIVLALVLAAANAYLALKIGLLTSASIPAAIISMSILRFIKGSNILQNNLVQTAASAGEAVAGGIVYTIPAMIIIGFWTHFSYWQNVAIAMIGGVLGVMFSIPIRRALVNEPALPFPEGRAIAEVLQIDASHGIGLGTIIQGAGIGSALAFAQTGLKVMAEQLSGWIKAGGTVFGFGIGFAPAMLGAGFLVGPQVCLSIFLGAVLGWLVMVPIFGAVFGLADAPTVTAQVMQLWQAKISYLAIGGMLTAGVWTLLSLLKPIWNSVRTTMAHRKQIAMNIRLRTEQDIPMKWVLVGTGTMLIAMYFLFAQSFPLAQLGLSFDVSLPFLLLSVLYVLVIGFIFSAICGYFSGLVGVTASPGSAVIIAGLLMAAFAIRTLLQHDVGLQITQQQLLTGAGITVMLGGIITGAAAIANDNIQDLKVGHLVGATPWKQQLMLLLGVVVSSLIIPWVMQSLFDVYGIAGVMPHPGMDPTRTLPAPPAALMAAITQSVFTHQVPWSMMALGVVLMSALIVIDKLKSLKLSILGVAIGIYLPLASSIPLALGGLMAAMVQKKLKQRQQRNEIGSQQVRTRLQQGMIMACGMVAGAALMEVVLAVPFAAAGHTDVLRVLSVKWTGLTEWSSIIAITLLGLWFYKTLTKTVKNV